MNIPVLVEQSGGERDSLHDKLQVFDALALLFESHGTTVINVDDNVVKGESIVVSTAMEFPNIDNAYLTMSTAISRGMCHAWMSLSTC